MARPVGRRGETRDRILPAALQLFAEHGVGGTSLQMIANRVGVTKAALYHQYPAKESIVLAVMQPLLDTMTDLVDRAETQPHPAERSDTVLRGLIDLMIEYRQLVAVFQGDPAVRDILDTYPTMQSLVARVGALLSGPKPDIGRRVAVELVGSGLMLMGVNPALAELDDDTLRREVLRAARRLLGPGPDQA